MPRRSYERMNKAAARAGARGLPRAVRRWHVAQERGG